MNDVALADQLKEKYKALKQEIGKVIIGQEETVDQVIIAILCQGHSLLMGVPGLAKTLLVQTIASVLDLKFNRIQFTPDLMPSDIVGAETIDSNRNLKFIRGPIFANIILADEINRTPPKTQAALLEAMQEKAVTIAGVTHTLDKPFFVLATQNPIEQEGTYPLPEAQLDRFMFNIILDYPSYQEEIAIIKSTTGINNTKLEAILTAEELMQYQQLVRSVPVADNVLEYAVSLVQKTRPNTPSASPVTNDLIDWGAGPRASQNLILGAKCHALLKGKYSPDIEDVQAVAIPILRHRLIRNFKAEAEGIAMDDIIKKLF